MENASKALIIAGAILLAILIISLGLIIFNNARDQAGNANLDEQTIQAFNSKFTTFEGDNVSGTKVNSLIQAVIASNQKEINDGTDKYVYIVFPTASSKNTGNQEVQWVVIGVKQNKIGYIEIKANYKYGMNHIKNINVEDITKYSTSEPLSVFSDRVYKIKIDFSNSTGLVRKIYVAPNEYTGF